MGSRESGTRGVEVQRVTDIPCVFHCELPRPADAKQATVVLSACVWCLRKRERKTESERVGVRERGREGHGVRLQEKQTGKECKMYNRKKVSAQRSFSKT